MANSLATDQGGNFLLEWIACLCTSRGVGYDHLTVRVKKSSNGVEKAILRFSHLPRIVFGKPDYQWYRVVEPKKDL